MGSPFSSVFPILAEVLHPVICPVSEMACASLHAGFLVLTEMTEKLIRHVVLLHRRFRMWVQSEEGYDQIWLYSFRALFLHMLKSKLYHYFYI